jgi:ribose-phosphate pyrophosphokinase
MKIKKYPDGTSYSVVEPTKEFIFRVKNYEDLWNLNQTVDALNNLGIRPTVTLPNLIDSQADRRFNNNESFGLKLVCKFLNSMNADFKIFHPHNPEVVEALLDNVQIIDNSEFISEVIKNIHVSDYKNAKIDRPTTIYAASNILDNLILMSTDAGGFKPLMKLADKLQWQGEVYGASKSRKYEDGKSKLVQVIDRQDFEAKDILIIDDICVYGGTFIGLGKMLRERNCGKIYLAVSHLTVENPNPELFSLFDKVFTTNSKYNTYLVKGTGHDKIGYHPENLEIINLF